jgi:hypothetical protein
VFCFENDGKEKEKTVFFPSPIDVRFSVFGESLPQELSPNH